MSREEIAEREVGHTDVRPAVACTLVLILMVTIFSTPVSRVASALVSGHTQFLPAMPRPISNRALLEWTKQLEKDLEENSTLTRSMRRLVRNVMAIVFGAGSEQVYRGKEGWLHYRPDFDHVTGPGFLDPAVLRRRSLAKDGSGAAIEPDPVRAVLDFQRKLQGIPLIVVPVPPKTGIRPDTIAAYPPGKHVLNSSYADFKARLERAGILVFDCLAPMSSLRASSDLYLRTDTHWRPEVVEACAEQLAGVVRAHSVLPDERSCDYRREEVWVEGEGDLAKMLALPAHSRERLAVERVSGPDAAPWRPDPAADVLLLGDSFTNVYSATGLGWGGGAGLAEQLSFHLKRPVDRIAINDGGSHTARAELSRLLVSGEARLSGKRVVIYEFAMRELSTGNWPLYDLPPAEVGGAVPGRETRLSGRILSISPFPDPNSTPYRDCIVSLRLRLDEPRPRELLLYLWGMRDGRLTEAAKLAVGGSIEARVRSWSDVASEYESYQRTELTEPDTFGLDAYWCESFVVR